MELETKFRCTDPREMKQKMRKRGFDIVEKKHQIDHYYIVSETDEDGIRHYFRLREDKETSKHSLDYHQVLSELETDENEVFIDDSDEASEILALLGHDVECVVDKQRTEYENDDVLITIDHIEELGDFVEFEMDGELTEKKKQRFDELIDHFDLDDADQVKNKGYPELIIQKGSE